jgi:hypothetical protein
MSSNGNNTGVPEAAALTEIRRRDGMVAEGSPRYRLAGESKTTTFRIQGGSTWTSA